MAEFYPIDRPGSAFSGAVDARTKGTIRDKDIQLNVLHAASVIAEELSKQTGKSVTAQITSGGQPTNGIPGITRTGSARHNEGYSTDFVLAVDGKKVRPNDNPGLYAQAAKIATQRGMQGVGVYNHSMHIGTPIGTPRAAIGKSVPETFWNGTKPGNRASKETADIVRQGYNEGLRNRGILGFPSPRPTGPAPSAPALPSPAPRDQLFAPNKVETFPLAPSNFDQARFDWAPNRPTDQSQRFAPMPARVDPARFAPQASVAELANQYSQYQRGMPAQPSGITATGRATGSVAESPRAVLSGSVNVPSRQQTVNVDPRRFDNFVNIPSAPSRNAYGAPTAIGQGAMTNAGTSNKGSIGPGNQAMVNLERSLMRPDPVRPSVEVSVAPSQSRISAPTQNLVDIPNSAAAPGRLSLADQYASYGAGKIAPQIASTATQAAPAQATPQRQATPQFPGYSYPSQQQAADMYNQSIGRIGQAVPQTVGPRSPNVAPNTIAPTNPANDAAKARFDAAKAGIYQGIPPSDIYDENAPGRSGFRGFGAGGFLGNLLTGNFGNMAGIERTSLPGILGVIQNVVQGLGGPQQAAQAVQTVAPALGQVMGMAPAQAAAKAGNNMVIGRDASGRIGWMADGGLSSGAMGAGWASNNPERNYGGYGGGYDPTPV